MKTQKQRDQKRREEKLAAIQQQIDQGNLKVRKMTPKERAEHPPLHRSRGRRTR